MKALSKAECRNHIQVEKVNVCMVSDINSDAGYSLLVETTATNETENSQIAEILSRKLFVCTFGIPQYFEKNKKGSAERRWKPAWRWGRLSVWALFPSIQPPAARPWRSICRMAGWRSAMYFPMCATGGTSFNGVPKIDYGWSSPSPRAASCSLASKVRRWSSGNCRCRLRAQARCHRSAPRRGQRWARG